MKFFISCGELSGDLHASHLVQELKKVFPQAKFLGIGGPNLAREGVEIILDIKDMGVVGFTEAVSAFPQVVKHYQVAKRYAEQCDICIFVDYPGFNLKLARSTKKMDKFNIYYILPQVWAWGEGRIKRLKSDFDLLLSIIPFEEDYFRNHGVIAHYVGSPVFDRYLEEKGKIEPINIPANFKVIGILPGSRKNEVSRLLPHITNIINILQKKRKDLFFVISRKIPFELSGHNILIWDGPPYSIMAQADVVISASGTATLETAFFEKPMVVIYKTSLLTYMIGKLLAKVKHISLVNLILGEKVVPEFVQEINEDQIASFVLKYLEDKQLYEKVVKKLQNLKAILKPNAAENAAKFISQEVKRHGYA
ncbi:MAG: lipid-A-disaccharide synthase [candidate division WOR-3 bacterium]